MPLARIRNLFRWNHRISAALLAGSVVTAGALSPGLRARASDAQQNSQILETGSEALYRLFDLWMPEFAKANPELSVATEASSTGRGITDAVNGEAQIGASGAYLSDTLVSVHPDMLNIPVAISIEIVSFHLPGLNEQNLRLSGPVLAGIYLGRITKWNDALIAGLNPGVSLPNHQIIPVHREDDSENTLAFTQYLALTAPDWNHAPGTGVTIAWPNIPGQFGANGDSGMIDALAKTPYSIGYANATHRRDIETKGLGMAALQNHDGQFVPPQTNGAVAAATAMAPRTPESGRIGLVYAPGPDSYPLVHYEYAVVDREQASPEMADAVRAFLSWAVNPSEGNSRKYTDKAQLAPLPEPVVKLSQNQIAQIHGPQETD